ncbi:MAG: hypothetical protein GTO55_03895 [Armatimonadetes bacterium]|nr:hypothetical protein [Armatimonadota bacterium]NIM23415.1 hypothetical protein [Armatimonadota bacterium]NIM67280.1 hypothetical protein [Armatimonadota bacterium]NIN05466.1 hypothetical protein [Armatimonadota bacterium]NIO75235.1 hypothetical protein [Armatimonadota bacterium]
MELLVVMSIILVLAAILCQTFTRAIAKARELASPGDGDGHHRLQLTNGHDLEGFALVDTIRTRALCDYV